MVSRTVTILALMLLVVSSLTSIDSDTHQLAEVDSDGDGWSDEWELRIGNDPFNSGDVFACNGLELLCQKPLDDVTFPETHNSHSSMDWGFLSYAANHETNLSGQLDAGYRSLMLDTHYNVDGNLPVMLCHGGYDDEYQGMHPCTWGAKPLAESLKIISDFLLDNPHEVILLSFENYVANDELLFEFEVAGIAEMTYVPNQFGEWDTLGEMITTNRRVVVFLDTENAISDWANPHGANIRSTSWGEFSVEELSCDAVHGSDSGSLYRMSTYLNYDIGLSWAHGAVIVNQPDFLYNRSVECWDELEMRPNMLTVDWWEQGDAVSVAHQLNLMSTTDS